MPRSIWCARRTPRQVAVKALLLEIDRPVVMLAVGVLPAAATAQAQEQAASRVRTSGINDMASGQRGGLRARKGVGERSLQQLRNVAREQGLKGRLSMNKAQLEKALQHRHDSEAPTDLAAHEATVADNGP